MSYSSPGRTCMVLAILSLFASGCGNSRQLQSVAVSPATANAQNFPNGQVQFSATGTFNKPPSPQPLTAKDVTWCVATGPDTGACAGNINKGAFVDTNGVANCVANFSGTATILAGQAMPSMNPDGGSQLRVFGKAQLVCP